MDDSLDLSRRKFLKRAAAFSAVSVVDIPEIFRSRPKEQPVLIIGGGAAGLAAAFSLARNGIPFHLAEASKRVGGRIFSVKNFNSDGQFVELGGELVDSNHFTLIRLAKFFGLEIEEFASQNNNREPSIYYIDGQIYSEEELNEALVPMGEYIDRVKRSLGFQKAGNTPITYHPKNLKKYNEKALVAFDHKPLAEFIDEMKDVEAWVKKIAHIGYVAEMGLETSEQSALNLPLLFGGNKKDGYQMFGDSDEFGRVKGGNSGLIDSLELFLSRGKGAANCPHFSLEYRLTHIRQNSSDQIECTFQTPSGGKTLKYGQVICALPFSILREVEGFQNLALSPVKKISIKELGYGANTKLMMGFSSRPWQKIGKSFMTSGPSQDFWETTRLQPGQSGIITNFTGGKRAEAMSFARQQEAFQDLEQACPGVTGFYSGQNAIMNWSKNPNSRGSYSSYRLGQNTGINGSAGETELKRRLYFAGEHTSMTAQGFMEGAFGTGISAAESVIRSRGKTPKTF